MAREIEYLQCVGGGPFDGAYFSSDKADDGFDAEGGRYVRATLSSEYLQRKGIALDNPLLRVVQDVFQWWPSASPARPEEPTE